MSNYTQTTFFTPKDSLPITDPNKTIFGAAYDVEFANLSAAVATKLDSTFTNPALISLNITGAATPANGFALPGSNNLTVFANSTQVWQWTTTTIAGFGTAVAAVATLSLTNTSTTATQDVAFTMTGGTSVLDIQVANQNRASAIIATNAGSPTTAQAAIWTTTGIPLVFGTAGKFAGQIGGSTQGLIWGNPTGGDKGVGTINATGLFINGIAASTSGTTVLGTGAAALNCSAIQVGQTYLVWRSAAGTNVVSNTTLQSDSVMNLTNIPIGNYTFQWFGGFVCSGGGLKFNILVTGAACTANMSAYAIDNNTAQSIGQNDVSTSLNGPNMSIGNSAGSPVMCFGQVQSGNAACALQLQYAQNSSNAAGTQVNAGCYMWITRLS